MEMVVTWDLSLSGEALSESAVPHGRIGWATRRNSRTATSRTAISILLALLAIRWAQGIEVSGSEISLGSASALSSSTSAMAIPLINYDKFAYSQRITI